LIDPLRVTGRPVFGVSVWEKWGGDDSLVCPWEVSKHMNYSSRSKPSFHTCTEVEEERWHGIYDAVLRNFELTGIVQIKIEIVTLDVMMHTSTRLVCDCV
jgi:hypothetical protein